MYIENDGHIDKGGGNNNNNNYSIYMALNLDKSNQSALIPQTFACIAITQATNNITKKKHCVL